MADDGGGHLTDTLVILIFVYLAGIATGILGFAYWKRPTTDKKEEEAEVPAVPPVHQDSVFLIEKTTMVVPPPTVRVGVTRTCYAYHDVDNSARCDEMIAFAKHAEGLPGGKLSKRFTPCKLCFPEGSKQTVDYHLARDGLPRGARPRQRVRDDVSLQVQD